MKKKILWPSKASVSLVYHHSSKRIHKKKRMGTMQLLWEIRAYKVIYISLAVAA